MADPIAPPPVHTIVHIGMPKTGTTTLQRTFTRNAERLLQAGIFYPVGLHSSPINHRILAAYALDPSSYPRHMRTLATAQRSRIAMAEFEAAVNTGLAQHRPSHLLLSAESLFTPIRRHKQSVYRHALANSAETLQFVAYLRAPAEAYLSVCQQQLKASRQLKRIAPPRYRAVIGSYRRTFATTPLALVPFARSGLHRGDIVADFCARFLAHTRLDAATLVRRPDSNTSLSAEAMAVIRHYRCHAWPGHDDRHNPATTAVLRQLKAVDRALGAPRPRLRDAVRERLERLAAPDLLWLRDQHGFSFPHCDYQALARTPVPLQPWWHAWTPPPARLNDLVVLNASRLADLVDALAARRYFQRSPGLQTWLIALRNASLASL
jgi:hypothetical protein